MGRSEDLPQQIVRVVQFSALDRHGIENGHGLPQRHRNDLGRFVSSKIPVQLCPLRSEAAQDLFNVLGTAFVRGYGREHELEADRLGAEYLARVGYDPRRGPLREGLGDGELRGRIAGIWTRRGDRYSEIRSEATAQLPRVEMSHIGG